MGSFLAITGALVLAYFVLVNGFQTVLLMSSALELGAYRRRAWGDEPRALLGSEVAPRVSVLAPAFNEQDTIVESVRALLSLRYPNLEVLVVNDGSTDATLANLAAAFELTPVHPIFRRQLETEPVVGLYRSRLHPHLVVINKENGGKADALNAGLNVSSGQLVCALDADSLVEHDALLRMVRPFLADPRVVAVGGTIRVANEADVRYGRVVRSGVPRHYLAGIQTVEYLRAFLFGRLGWNRLGGNLIISGAFGLFDRERVLAAGGYESSTVGEDLELIAKIRRLAHEGSEPGGSSSCPTRSRGPRSPRASGRSGHNVTGGTGVSPMSSGGTVGPSAARGTARWGRWRCRSSSSSNCWPRWSSCWAWWSSRSHCRWGRWTRPSRGPCCSSPTGGPCC